MKHFSNPDPESQEKEGVGSLVGLALGNEGGQIGRLKIEMNTLREKMPGRFEQWLKHFLLYQCNTLMKTVFLSFLIQL